MAFFLPHDIQAYVTTFVGLRAALDTSVTVLCLPTYEMTYIDDNRMLRRKFRLIRGDIVWQKEENVHRV